MSEETVMEKLNRLLSLVGNLGVIAGIVFLAYEINANTNAVRSATYQAFNDSSFSWADTQIEQAAMLADTASQHTTLGELTGEQRLIYRGFMFKTFTVMESNYLHHRAGSMDDDVFESKVQGSVAALLANPLWLESWEERRNLSLAEFREFMNARIKAAQSGDG